MNITCKFGPEEQGSRDVTLVLEGRFGNNSASDVETAVKEVLPGCRKLTFDFAGVDYISSAGLRVLLIARRGAGEEVPVVISNANSVVKEILEMSGFSRYFRVE